MHIYVDISYTYIIYTYISDPVATLATLYTPNSCIHICTHNVYTICVFMYISHLYIIYICVSDPVATLAIFHTLDVDPTLYMLVFGESGIFTCTYR